MFPGIRNINIRNINYTILDLTSIVDKAHFFSVHIKTLHPLLETGSDEDEEVSDPSYKKVAFIGISNWALDPAKMNRGILVSREEPDVRELVETAR